MYGVLCFRVHHCACGRGSMMEDRTSEGLRSLRWSPRALCCDNQPLCVNQSTQPTLPSAHASPPRLFLNLQITCENHPELHYHPLGWSCDHAQATNGIIGPYSSASLPSLALGRQALSMRFHTVCNTIGRLIRAVSSDSRLVGHSSLQ